jgi:hypothetical protein
MRSAFAAVPLSDAQLSAHSARGSSGRWRYFQAASAVPCSNSLMVSKGWMGLTSAFTLKDGFELVV